MRTNRRIYLRKIIPNCESLLILLRREEGTDVVLKVGTNPWKRTKPPSPQLYAEYRPVGMRDINDPSGCAVNDYKKCPVDSSHVGFEVRNYSFIWHDGDVHCAQCGAYIRMYDAG